MHEASIALAVVEEIAERLADEPIEQVVCVRLQVGAFTGVVPDALNFAWQAVTDGTVVEGARLEIERVPLEIFCRPCGRSSEIERKHPLLPLCPQCDTPSAEIVRGRELFITSLEVAYADGNGQRRTSDTSQERCARAGIA